MYKQNYKSDFKFVMRRYRCVADKEELTPVPWPEDIDWRLLLKTPHSAKAYEASCRGGVMRNCAKTEDGGILIAMDKHGLSPGELRYEFHFELPDPVMASGIADLYKPGSTGIMLTTDATCECGGLVDVAVLADMYKDERKANETARQTAETEREKALSDIIAQAQSALRAANEAIAAADKATQLANDAAELCAKRIAQFEAIGKEILSHQYLTIEN